MIPPLYNTSIMGSPFGPLYITTFSRSSKRRSFRGPQDDRTLLETSSDPSNPIMTVIKPHVLIYRLRSITLDTLRMCSSLEPFQDHLLSIAPYPSDAIACRSICMVSNTTSPRTPYKGPHLGAL